jgi:hypothetical protein
MDGAGKATAKISSTETDDRGRTQLNLRKGQTPRTLPPLFSRVDRRGIIAKSTFSAKGADDRTLVPTQIYQLALNGYRRKAR